MATFRVRSRGSSGALWLPLFDEISIKVILFSVSAVYVYKLERSSKLLIIDLTLAPFQTYGTINPLAAVRYSPASEEVPHELQLLHQREADRCLCVWWK